MSYINKEELIKRMQVCAPMNWTDTDFELGEEAQYKSDREVVESCAEVNAIPIPPRATNGDIIKAMFPNIDFAEMSCTVHATTSVTSNGVKGGISYDFWKDWWNAPYKAESEG